MSRPPIEAILAVTRHAWFGATGDRPEPLYVVSPAWFFRPTVAPQPRPAAADGRARSIGRVAG